MPASRKRRLLRQTVLAVGGMILFISAYVGTYLADRWWKVLPSQVTDVIYAPLHLYDWLDLPGSVELEAMSHWCTFRGHYPFELWYDITSEKRQLIRQIRELRGNPPTEADPTQADTRSDAEPDPLSE